MTLDQAKQEYPNFQQFQQTICDSCTSNDWYCPRLCNELLKASGMPFDKIQSAISRHDEDMRKVIRYIKQYKGE
jgi:hypothetical protein